MKTNTRAEADPTAIKEMTNATLSFKMARQQQGAAFYSAFAIASVSSSIHPFCFNPAA
jgi:hypothetical protein